ncbi:hypothetical protein B6B07_003657 [Salmonella enterica subsp. enterica serovar Berta]|nr:hypothetical protein [Salmonella enterica subsp. enterica serovar Berta]
MTEHLFGTNKNYFDSGDFSHRYSYQLRGCVPPPLRKRKEVEVLKPVNNTPRQKSIRELAMDKARAKANRRYRG